MKIVIDTNIIASAIFFGGKPAELLKMVLSHSVYAVVTQEILDEYQATIDYLLEKYKGKKLNFSTVPIFSAMELIHSTTHIEICRDVDDNKFIECAIDGSAFIL